MRHLPSIVILAVTILLFGGNPVHSAPQIIHVDLELDDIIKAIKAGNPPSNSSSAQVEGRDLDLAELTRQAVAPSQGMDLYHILTDHVIDKLMMTLLWHWLLPYEG